VGRRHLDADRFWVQVQVQEEPAALGTMLWMMRAAGALTVTEDDGPNRS
jgi:hypothetical protein